MAASPRLKIYNPEGEYVASCKYAEDAAALIAFLGDGAMIKASHRAEVWVEGKESQPASDSYAFVADTVHAREREFSVSRGKIKQWRTS